MKCVMSEQVKAGDKFIAIGYAVIVRDQSGRDAFGGILTSHDDAVEYAKAKYRGRNWRVYRVKVDARTGEASIDHEGTLEAVL